MKNDNKGCSTCLAGEEQHETFKHPFRNERFVQYDFRDSSGVLFSTVAKTLKECRRKRDQFFKTV